MLHPASASSELTANLLHEGLFSHPALAEHAGEGKQQLLTITLLGIICIYVWKDGAMLPGAVHQARVLPQDPLPPLRAQQGPLLPGSTGTICHHTNDTVLAVDIL